MAANRLAVLMLGAAGLGALLWLDMQPEHKGADVGAPPPPAPDSGSRSKLATPLPGGEMANPLASLDKESLGNITERPLFAPTRRPPPAPVPPAATPLAPPQPAPPRAPDYTLLGILRDGDRAIALLRHRSEGRSLRVEAGDTIGGWEIAAVGAVSVRLKGRDGAAHELRLAPR